jgi:hypothetical protein
MKRTWLVVSTALFVALIAGSAWFIATRRVPDLDFGPIPKGAHVLAQSEIENLLADHYTVIRHVRQVPLVLKESFSNVTSLPFDMKNPGDPMSTDAIIHAPSRQLIFGAVGRQSAILVYEQGSFASFPCAVIFSRTGAAAWIAIDDNRPKDIAALRRSVHEARFSPMKPNT